ncbi:MAG: hypothetical protein Q8P13_02710 [bacterium]|nr:hypothetical protein [bacterium]
MFKKILVSTALLVFLPTGAYAATPALSFAPGPLPIPEPLPLPLPQPILLPRPCLFAPLPQVEDYLAKPSSPVTITGQSRQQAFGKGTIFSSLNNATVSLKGKGIVLIKKGSKQIISKKGFREAHTNRGWRIFKGAGELSVSSNSLQIKFIGTGKVNLSGSGTTTYSGYWKITLWRIWYPICGVFEERLEAPTILKN